MANNLAVYLSQSQSYGKDINSPYANTEFIVIVPGLEYSFSPKGIVSLTPDSYPVLSGAFNAVKGKTILSITYIAKFNHTSQGFITYQVGAEANNATGIDFGDALYVYTEADSLLLRQNITEPPLKENCTLPNATAGSTLWNLVGSPYKDFNLSSLVTGTNSTTVVSFHNITNGYYYSYYRNFGPLGNDLPMRSADERCVVPPWGKRGALFL